MSYNWGEVSGYINGKYVKKFRLTGPDVYETFDTYDELYEYCQKHNINARVI